MKRETSGFVWAYLLGLVIILSCNKDRGTEFFELNHFVDFEIQPGLNTFDTHFFTISPLESVYDIKLASSGKTSAEVEKIVAKDATLSSTFGDVNLKFIERISIYIFDPFEPSNKIEFFYFDPTPFKNTTEWRLFPGLADVREWIESEYFGIEVRLNFREVSPSATPMRLNFDLSVLGD